MLHTYRHSSCHWHQARCIFINSETLRHLKPNFFSSAHATWGNEAIVKLFEPQHSWTWEIGCCNLHNRDFKANVVRLPVQWLSISSLRTKLRWIVGYSKVSRIYALQLHYPQKKAIGTRSLRRKLINIFLYLFATMKLVSQNQTSPNCPSLWLCLAMSQGWPTHWPKRHPKQHQKHSPKRRPRKQQRRPVGQRPGDRFQQTGNMLILSKSYCHILVKDFNMTSTPHCCVLFQSNHLSVWCRIWLPSDLEYRCIRCC